jgi:hypothetical protein
MPPTRTRREKFSVFRRETVFAAFPRRLADVTVLSHHLGAWAMSISPGSLDIGSREVTRRGRPACSIFIVLLFDGFDSTVPQIPGSSNRWLIEIRVGGASG